MILIFLITNSKSKEREFNVGSIFKRLSKVCQTTISEIFIAIKNKIY